ncbi:MAG: MnhB domain-containing protein [Chloroflexota bacterium]
MTERHSSLILHFIVRVFMVPLILVFAAYVFVHGESSPGGGFQAGAIAASAVILARLTLGREHGIRRYPTRMLIWLSSLGVGIYALAGVLPVLYGGPFLDYDAIPLQWFNVFAGEEYTNRSMGLFIIELGVYVGVFATLVLIYDYLTERFQDAG